MEVIDMNPLRKIKTIPLPGSVLRVVGWFFLIGGVVGQMMQAWLVAQAGDGALLDLLESNSGLMTMATVAMMLSVLEYLAVPIFAFLLVEGVIHTSHFGKYFLRVAALALICQLLYGLRNAGPNPVFALVMAMIMLYFFRQFSKKGVGSVLIRITAVLGCLMWSLMLSIPHGAACVLITAALWLLKDKQYFRTFGGFTVTILCSIFSPAYAAASISFLILHFYNGERGKSLRAVSYLFYPLLLAVAAAVQLL